MNNIDMLIANVVITPPCEERDTVYVIDLYDFEPCKTSGNCGGVCSYLYSEGGVRYGCLKGKYGAKPFACAGIKSIKTEGIPQDDESRQDLPCSSPSARPKSRSSILCRIKQWYRKRYHNNGQSPLLSQKP